MPSSKPALCLVLLFALAQAPPFAQADAANVFVTPDGQTRDAHLARSSPCAGPVTLTLTLAATDVLPEQTRVVHAYQLLSPDPCSFACTGCSFTYEYVVLGPAKVRLAGMGTSGTGEWTLAGSFGEGLLVAHHPADYPCGGPCLD